MFKSWLVCLSMFLSAIGLFADSLTPSAVTDSKGNTPDSDWQFWFELAHKPGHFERLDTPSTKVPAKGVAKKITGPIASLLPNPDDSEGWIFHTDWDGRFEGVWADKKTKSVLVHPYVEKTFHGSVAIAYRIPNDGEYDVTGAMTDIDIKPEVAKHDGVEWILELAEGGKPIKKLASGGPFGDGNGRPDNDKFVCKKVTAKKGQLIRLVINPRKWWGSDLTRIDEFKIEPVEKSECVPQDPKKDAEPEPPARTPEQLAKLEKYRCPKPKQFAIVFSFGYAGDSMPKDDKTFESLLTKIKDAGFNTIHCTYTDERLALCKKHNIQMMVDLLAEEHHVYKTADKAKAICEKLKDNPTVWGYNIWNDPVRKTTPGRLRDIYNVREWDPTHPAYCGTYRTDGMSTLNHPDILGYYDFHWKRGIDQHFPHLLAFSKWAKDRDAFFYSWLSVTSGIAGKGNYNRSLWSANTAIACGQKGILWFLATDMMKKDTLEWTELGKDITKVNLAIAPLKDELLKIGQPVAIYSTPITKTSNNDPVPDDKKTKYPPGLDKNAIPDDFWLKVQSGEVVLGVYQDDKKRDAVFIANNNAYQEQTVTIKLTGRPNANLFDREKGKWVPLEGEKGTFTFKLSAGGGELLRFEK